jgi:hypothetical protein
MRFTPVIIASLLSLTFSSPASSCLGQVLETSIFFTTPPVFKSMDAVLIKVVLTAVKGGMASAKVTKILKDPTRSIRVGSKVSIEYNFSSCGPNYRAGEEGIIWAKVSRKNGQIKLSPYLRRYEDGQISPPKGNS